MTIIGDASKARLIAVFVDHFIAVALMLLVVALVPERLPVVKAVLFFVIYLAYFVVLEALWSRTFGKFFQGLVVRKLDGDLCDWRSALIRGSLRIIEVNPLLLGGLPAGLGDHFYQAKAAPRRSVCRHSRCFGQIDLAVPVRRLTNNRSQLSSGHA